MKQTLDVLVFRAFVWFSDVLVLLAWCFQRFSRNVECLQTEYHLFNRSPTFCQLFAYRFLHHSQSIRPSFVHNLTIIRENPGHPCRLPERPQMQEVAYYKANPPDLFEFKGGLEHDEMREFEQGHHRRVKDMLKRSCVKII